MKNVTITVPDAVAKWARVWAARYATSVSRMVGELLTVRMREDEACDAAMRRYLQKAPQSLRDGDAPYPKRDTLHDR